MLLHRELAVVTGDGGAGATATTVAQKRQVGAGFEGEIVFRKLEAAEFDEVVAAATGAELAPRLVFQTSGQRRDRPVLVHHLVLTTFLEGRSDAEAGLALDRLDQFSGITIEGVHRQVQHGHLHATSDVDTDRVGDDRVLRGQHAADRQTVAAMGIGHQGTANGDRQLASVLQLLDRCRFEVVSPLAVGGRIGAGHVGAGARSSWRPGPRRARRTGRRRERNRERQRGRGSAGGACRWGAPPPWTPGSPPARCGQVLLPGCRGS